MVYMLTQSPSSLTRALVMTSTSKRVNSKSDEELSSHRRGIPPARLSSYDPYKGMMNECG
jgi:hypothetical protein